MLLEVRKINNNKIAQANANVVISATILVPSKGEAQSIWVRLYVIKPNDIIIKIRVKILIWVVQIRL